MGSDVIMTDSGSAPPDADADRLLTTGKAAEVIAASIPGFTRRQVIEMIDADEIVYHRPAPHKWARIPLSAAVAKRDELVRARVALQDQVRRQIEQAEQRAREAPDGLAPPWGTEPPTSP